MTLSAPELIASAALMAAAVSALLSAEARGSVAGRRIFKPLASTLFVAIALYAGALESTFGRLMLVALLLSFVGDLLLMAPSKTAFLAGLASFLLAHISFGVAFLLKPLDTRWLALASVAMTLAAIVILRWLWPHLARDMRLPVIAYVLAISGMMILAAGTVSGSGAGFAIAAGLFVISDVFVAREQFVSPAPSNRLVGLPVYYAAQLLYAWQAS